MRRTIIGLLLLSGGGLCAQDYSHDLTGITKVVISAETNVLVKTYEAESLLLKASENVREERPAAARGLTSLTSRGEDNTNYGVAIQQEGDQLIVTGLRDRLADDLVIRLPPDMNVSVEVLVNNDISVEGFESEIEAINHLGEITLMDITGPVVAESNHGNILVVYSEVSQLSPSSFVVATGDIDLTIPTDAAISLQSKTPRGDFYTNFDLQQTQERDERDYKRTIVGDINGGGVFIELQSHAGNIYVRKLE